MTDPRVCQPGPQRAPSSTAARRSRMPPRACVCPHGACPTAPPPHPVQPPAPTALFSVSMTLSFPECHTNGVVKGDVWKWRLPVGVVLRSPSGCFPVSLSLSLPVAHCGLTVRLSTALGVISLRGLTGSVELQKSQTPVGAARRPAFPCQVPKVPSSTPEVFCVFLQGFHSLAFPFKSNSFLVNFCIRQEVQVKGLVLGFWGYLWASGGSSTTHCEGWLPLRDSLLHLCQRSAGRIRRVCSGVRCSSVCECHPPVPSCVECCNRCTRPSLLRIASAVRGLSPFPGNSLTSGGNRVQPTDGCRHRWVCRPLTALDASCQPCVLFSTRGPNSVRVLLDSHLSVSFFFLILVPTHSSLIVRGNS